MKLHVERDMSHAIRRVLIEVRGAAARIPSTSNSRFNYFPKKRIEERIAHLTNRVRHGDLSRVDIVRSLDDVRRLVQQSKIVSTINPEHKERLDALSRLWASIRNKPDLNLASKDEKWLATLHCPELLNRVDSHNLTKPVCDWLQSMGIISNDKHMDCWPMRNEEFWPIKLLREKDSLYIAMRRTKDIARECEHFIMTMLGDNSPNGRNNQQNLFDKQAV